MTRMRTCGEWFIRMPYMAFWMQETGFSLFMVEKFWNVPIAQAIHILSIGSAFGATLMMVLRINGRAGAGLTIEQSGARFLPWIRWGLGA